MFEPWVFQFWDLLYPLVIKHGNINAIYECPIKTSIDNHLQGIAYVYIYITSYGQNIVYWVMDGAILLGIVNGWI